LTGLPTSANHNGGIIKFGPDGKLYVIIGDAENPDSARNLDSLAGKILRVNSDGSAPTDNPFYFNGAGNRDKVYSRGHRNSFGFTFHPQTGDLWESENGPDSPEFDEVNRVTRGGDYGWDSSVQSGCRNSPPLIDPIVQFSIFAPTGIVAFPANSAIYPSAFQNNLLVSGFNDGTIRLVIANPAVQCGSGNTTVAYPGNVGGLISLMLGSDGYVYVSSTDGVIYRVIPH
jgi:glucose/arabinose dehydrogenase